MQKEIEDAKAKHNERLQGELERLHENYREPAKYHMDGVTPWLVSEEDQCDPFPLNF